MAVTFDDLQAPDANAGNDDLPPSFYGQSDTAPPPPASTSNAVTFDDLQAPAGPIATNTVNGLDYNSPSLESQPASPPPLAGPVQAGAQAAENAWNEGPIINTPATERLMQDVGIYRTPGAGPQPASAITESVARPLITAGDWALRGIGAGFRGAQAGVAQLGTELGYPALGRDIAALPEAFAGSPDFAGIPREPVPPGGPIAPYAHVPEGMAPWESRAVQPGVPLPEGFAVPGAAPPPEPPPAPAGPVPGGPAPAAPAGGGAAVQPPVPGPRLPEGGTVEEVPVVQPDGSVILEQVLTQTQQPPPAAPENAPSPVAGEPPPQVAPTVAPEPAVAAAPGAGASLPPPRSPATIMEQDGVGGPQAIRRANAERAAYLAATGQEPPRDQRGELEAILADPRSNQEIQDELDAPKIAALQQTTDNLPHGFSIQQQGDDWVLTDPAGTEQMRVTARLPSEDASAQMGQTAAQLASTVDYSAHNRIGDGTAANPIVPHQPSDMAAAAQQIDQNATPAMQAAENYRMAHTDIGGMDVSVETAAGQMRKGVGPDGTPWEVQLPYDYGHINGTIGADGQQLDIALGPEAHRATQLPVYVIDQKDAHSWQFDEHKAFAGFPTMQAAEAAYREGFSDGLGPQRMGAITPMTFEQFKQWAYAGPKTQAVAYQPPPVMTPQKRRAVFNRPMSLLEFLAASGGVRDDRGELAHIGLTKKFIPKLGRLVRKNGMHLDRARELAQEAGYLPAESNNGPPQIGINELLKLMAEEAAGRKVFTPEDEAEMLAAEQARQQEVEKARFEEARQAVTEFATNAGMNLNPAEISEASIAVMGGRDVRDAVADVCLHAALEADAAAAEVAEEGSDWDIPFDWETDPNVEPGEFPGVATASESSEPTGTGSEPAGHASAGGVQPESGNGPVQTPPGGRPEAVPGHGERPATGAAEPEFDILNPVTGRERAEARGRRPLQGGNAPADNGLFSPAASGQTDLVEAVKAARNFGSIAAPNVPELAQEFARRFIGGEKFATIQQARKVASALLDGPVQAGTIAAKAIDEAVELGAVLAARDIVAKGNQPFPSGYVTPPGVIFDRLVQLYEEQQPKLGTRTSDSIERQAYSTPLPLAYLASRLAGVAQSGSVFEPTAGNGALLIEATPDKAFPNEIDPTRLAGLQAQGFKVSDFNAAQIPTFARAFDTLIANPPFGVVKDEQGATIRYPLDFIQPGYDTGEIDHAISLFSLETMKDDGTSVLILGGLNKLLRTPGARADGYNAKAKREFFFALYGHYNVVDHFTVPGELYEKQGAGWPVDVIVIRGRGKSKLPLPSVAAPRIVGSWSALKEVLDVSIHGAGPGQALAAAGSPGGVGSAEQPGGQQHPAPQERPEGRQPVQAGLSQHPGGQGGVANQPGGQPAGGATPSGGGAGAAGGVERAQPVREPVGRSEANAGGQSSVAGSSNVRSEPAQEPVAGPANASGGQGSAGNATGGVDRGSVQEPERPAGGVEPSDEGEKIDKELAAPPPDPQDQAPAPKKKPKVEAPTTPQVPYEPRSKAKPVGTLVPTNLRTATQEALQQLEERVGPVDAFVAEKLGYKPGQVGEYFSAEQIDAIALGIQNIDSGAGFIIGDQTGVGKGRFVAAMIRYADRQGLTPVFVTEKPNLYIDMVRDLTDIGMADFVDAILPTNSGLRLPLTDDPNGPVMRTADGKAQDAILREAADSRKLPEGKRALFTTYSQQQQIKETDTTRMRLLRSLAPNAFVILDEAHNAGGAGAQADERQKAGKTTRSKHFREVVQAARSVAYSSATWAKRPDVLDLYGAKTSMREAVDSLPQLAEAVRKGGVPMQQIITAQLAAVGQYARRERSFDGVSYQLKPVEVDRKAYDQIAGVLADIFRISEDYAKPAVKEISKTIRAEAKAMAGADGAIGAAGASSTGFGAIMHNLINQMLLASKTQATVDRALEKLKEGKKPVITVANTMGSFIAEFAEQTGVSPGQPIDLTFNNLLMRYLERTLRYTTKKPFSSEKGEVHWLKPSELGSTGEALFNRVKDSIRALGLDNLPVSPIDYMRAELAKAGYKVAEITGRTEAADYRADGRVYYRQRSEKEIGVKGRLAAIRAFNKGELDVMILNQAGATGLSLHASEKNPKAGQAKRAMLIAQAEGNIDTHMQMLGRVHRTGQVIAPEYEQLVANVPAEQRPAAVLAAKMASLTASTTSARKNVLSADAAPDFMNKYGGQVIEAILMEDAELNRALGSLAGDEEVDGETLARKATGRIPLLPLAQQEEVYKRIEERYRRLLEELDAAGENALEAKTLDLDAKPLESKTLTEGKGSSPFSSPSQLERMDVKRTTKPPAPHQVVHMVAGGMGVEKTLPTPEELQKEPNTALATRISRMMAGRGEEMVDDALGKISGAVDAERTKAETLFKDPDAKKRHMQKVDANRDRLSAVARVAHPGSVISVTPANEMLPVSAVVIGLHQSGKNAVAPSAWDISILTEDGIRRTIPASQLYTEDNRPQSAAPEGARVLSSNPMQPQQFLDRLAEHGKSGREERWIITGNILAGFAKKPGQIINFTDADGKVRQGVMMARDFDAAGFLSTQAQPLRGELGTAFLQQRYGETPPFLTSSNGVLRIAQDTKGGYVISVPQSKKEGAAFYLDKPLQRALGPGNQFVSSSGQMRARFSGADLPDVMEAIDKVLRDEGTYLVSDHPEAKKFAQANRTVASSAKIQGWDAVETEPETIKPAAFKVLAESVGAMTGNRVNIRYVDGQIRLADPQAPGGYHKVYGISSGAVLITVALGTPSGTAWTLNHEAVHSLRSFGLIEPAEWKVLERAVDQQGWAVKYHVRDYYRGQPEDVQREEAIAEAFADFMANRKPTPAGMIGRAVQRTSRFLGRLRSGLEGQGFTRPEDVFERIASGKVGKREAKPMPGRVITDLPSAIKAEILNGFSYHPKEMAQTLVDLAQTGEVDRDVAVEVAKSFAALVAPGTPPAAQPNTIVTAGGVANTIITHLTNFERLVGEMVEPKAHPSPMAHPSTSDEARELAKSFANARRWIRWATNREIDRLTREFTPQQRERMWEAADAESVALQTGNSPAGVGLDTLSPDERSTVERLQLLAQIAFRQAKAVGIVRKDADEIPSYVPRMVINIGMQDEQTKIVRDIRTLALAISQVQDAVIGRKLINNIKEIGARSGSGQPTVKEGYSIGRPLDPLLGITTSTARTLHRKHLTAEETEAAARQIPDQEDDGFFTIPQSRAFYTWRWAGKNEDGEDQFERVPVRVRKDFEGALRAVLRGPDRRIYRAILDLKGRMMTTIMYGVAHLAVIAGRALPYSPNVLRLRREGSIVRDDEQIMKRAISHGMVPIGQRFGFQDAEGLDPYRELRPGRSWTAQIVGALPSVFSRSAGDATKRAVDKAGHILHTRMLWDQVANIQAGSFVKFERDFIKMMGMGPYEAAELAAHFANRVAGALPQEAMASWVQKAANLLLFSRSYRIGNLGMVKDAVKGLPRDMQARLLKVLSEADMKKVNRKAKNFAISVLVADMMLFHIGNSTLQSAAAVLRGDHTIPQEMHGYIDRFEREMKHLEGSPLSALNVFGVLKSLTPMADNEPGKSDRILVGYEKDGTGIYLRNPFGKAIEDTVDYFTQPLRTVGSMVSPFVRALVPVVTAIADGGVARDSRDNIVWDPYMQTPGEVVGALGDYAQYVLGSVTPEMALQSGYNAVTGQGRWGGTMEGAKIIGGGLGFSLSHGYPAGPARGEIHLMQQEHQFEVDKAFPQITQMIRNNDIKGATELMSKLGMRPQQMRGIIFQAKQPHTTANQLRAIMRYASPEQMQQLQERLQGDREHQRAR